MPDPAHPLSSAPAVHLDLRGTPCPLNYVRSRLALERLSAGEFLEIDLDGGEPERMVAEGLRGEGHEVVVEPLLPGEGASAVRLRVQRGG
jgi:TusA-related sulfurtransferase